MLNNDIDYQKAVDVIKSGGVIAYPTESVYGIGGDPFNNDVVEKILLIKNRPLAKGMILVCASFEQAKDLIALDSLSKKHIDHLLSKWPGPYTFIVPASDKVPKSITGYKDTVAIRVSSNPTICKLCNLYGKPIISTSCNVTGEQPLLTYDMVRTRFENLIDFILDDKVEGLQNTTSIVNLLTGEVLR